MHATAPTANHRIRCTACTPRRAARWRSQSGIRLVIYFAALLLVAVLVTLATRHAPVGPSAAEQPESGSAAASDDAKPVKVGPYQGQPLDQPIPVPASRWSGWRNHAEGRCAWIPRGLFDRLRLTGPPRPDTSACTVTADDGTRIRIVWGAPYSRVTIPRRDDPRFVTSVAGLDARQTAPFLIGLIYPGACRIDVTTRSLTGLTVMTWHPDRGGDRCHMAETAATLIAHALIPAAGGRPWSTTPQHLAQAVVVDPTLCDRLGDVLHAITGDERAITYRTGPAGQECHYARAASVDTDDIGVDLLLTAPSTETARGLDLVALPTADTRRRALGPLPARQDAALGGCSLSTELQPGRLFRTNYHSVAPADHDCATAELIAAHITQAMFEHVAT